MQIFRSKITNKGKVTIPRTIREKLHLKSGCQVEFILRGDFVIAVAIDKAASSIKGLD